VRMPGAELLKAMLTGDGVKDNLSPYYSVSWQQTDDGFTALVTDATAERLDIQVFHHGKDSREIQMRVWRLAPGEYHFRCYAPGAARREEKLTVSQPGQRVPLRLPSRRLLRVTLERTL
jgi:hypothetical protein